MPYQPTKEWHPTQEVYMALAEEFGEDNDEEAIAAFTEILVKKELRVSLTLPLMVKCRDYCALWANDEDAVTTAAILAGELPPNLIVHARRAAFELGLMVQRWEEENAS